MRGTDEDASSSPEEQAREGTEDSFSTAKLRADVARQQMRLAKDQLKRARKRFKEARREARRARKLADVARRAWRRNKRRNKNDGKGVAKEPGKAKESAVTRGRSASKRAAVAPPAPKARAGRRKGRATTRA